ncbi:MAG: N-acetylmuramoyl-L-alanine amidase [Clostridia bacterium]|nr:N-acetylmuramoyl-L-alanine amidase [Clostridia bacterium]
MKQLILRSSALLTGVALAATTAFFALHQRSLPFTDPILADNLPSVNRESKRPTVILDPGHGGQDGGASGSDGTLEKDLNLQVARRTAALLKIMGYNVILTRDEDVMLGEGAVGHKKLADLQYRLDLANGSKDALLISIHMNKFPMEYCNGIQLYYSENNEQSLVLANALHTLVKDFQKDNIREVKKATSSIYLMDRVQIPAVLFECGFLSNERECALLKDEDYQKALAVLIVSALGAYEQQTAS